MSEKIDFMALAHEVFPEIPHTEEGENFLGYVLWNRTGYPCFWDGDPATVCRQQLQAFRDTRGATP